MNASEALQARLALGLRPEDVAVEVGATPDAIAAWESGRIRVPKQVEAHLTWRVALQERSRALAGSGLPECSWLPAFEQRSEPKGMAARAKQVEELTAHLKTCDVCKARDAYIADRFPPMPRPPLRGWMAIAMPVFDRINRLPAWAQPAATGAVMFTAYSLFKLIFYIPTILRDPIRGTLTALGGIALSASIGGAVGLVYGQYRRLRDGRVARDTA